MSISKNELIKRLAEQSGLKQVEVTRVLDSYAEVAATELSASGEVLIPGIGKLKIKRRDARDGRNPQTGETIQLPAKNVVKLSVAKAFDEAVQ